MERADQNPLLPQGTRSLETLFKDRVLVIDRPPRDRTVNQDIEDFGAHLGGGPHHPVSGTQNKIGNDDLHEAAWLRRNLKKT